MSGKEKAKSKKARSKIELLLTEGKEIEHDLGHENDAFDEDLDLDAVGREFFAHNRLSLFTCALSGLLVLMYVPSILKVLVATGKSKDPLLSFRRYLSTLNHMLDW